MGISLFQPPLSKVTIVVIIIIIIVADPSMGVYTTNLELAFVDSIISKNIVCS